MSVKIKIQNLLPDKEFICFVIPGLLDKNDCENLLNDNIKKAFQKAISNYPTYYRNNDRLVIDDAKLAAQLFTKVKKYLPKQIHTNSVIQSENGLWSLSKLNDRLRFCKYSANQYFHRHLDGIHYRSETEQSKLTFMIYLNNADEFKGGRTLFYRTKDAKEILASYIPKQGDLIVFDHNVWHEGEKLKSGEKFVLRSDILYSKSKVKSIKVPFGGHLGYIWKLLKFDSETILSGGRDKEIKTWTFEGKQIQSLKSHSHSILCLEKLDNNTFISGSRDKQIKVWKTLNKKFELFNTIAIHSAVVLSLCKLSKTLFASSSGDNTIKICNLNGQVQSELKEHANWVWQVIKLHGFFIASCSEDHAIKIWDHRDSNSIVTFLDTAPVITLNFNKLTNELVSGNLNGIITIRKIDKNFKEVSKKSIKAHNGIVRSIIHINRSLIASAGEDNKVKIWNTENGNCILELKHENFVQSIILINKNKLLSASYDGTIKQWDLLNEPTIK
jgi:hypothetical protein